MKRLVKSLMRKCWGATGPVRRPLVRKIDGKIAGTMSHAVREETHARLDLLLHVMNVARQEANAYRSDTNLVLDALVREVSRMQFQIEAMEERLFEAQVDRDELGVVADEAA